MTVGRRRTDAEQEGSWGKDGLGEQGGDLLGKLRGDIAELTGVHVVGEEYSSRCNSDAAEGAKTASSPGG